MADSEHPALPGREELLRRLDEASERGSVAATKLLLEELRRDQASESPEDELERLMGSA
jgi:hypothetical protein